MIREQNLQVTDAPNMAYDAVLTAGNFKPILFSTPMVQAILRGEKTQTRRLIKPEPNIKDGYVIEPCNHYKGFDFMQKKLIGSNPDRFEIITSIKCPYKIGDILWVRETFTILETEHCEGMSERFYYKADHHHEMNEDWRLECIRDGYPYKWKPSLFMPRSACRIFLKIKSIRVERLNNISENDAIAEGIERWVETRMVSKPTHYKVYFQNCKPEDLCSYTSDPIDSYETLWQKINGEKSWSKNPFVWVYEFERTDASFACS